MKKIVICGGHLTPALALIDELKDKNLEIVFFGRKFATEGSKNLSAEYKTIQKLNIDFYAITAGRLQRKFTSHTIPAILKIPVGFIQSLYYLIRYNPHLIVSFGGYLSLPVVFAGWLLGIKSITHEQSVKLGLANRINSIFCDTVYLSWKEMAGNFSSAKYKVIGNLTRQSIFSKNAKHPKIRGILKTDKKLILVSGGNQGSHFINRLIFDLLPNLSNYQILHQVGTANFEGDWQKAKNIKRVNYLAVDYLEGNDFGAAVNRADLVITRSGANTVWDLAILAKPSILIPLPISAGGEQKENGKILEKAGSAIILDQKELTAQTLTQRINYMIKNLPKFQKSAESFAKSLATNSAQIFASEILKKVKD